MFLDGRAGVKKDKRGFIDLKSNIVIPLIYDEVYGFSNGRAEVKKDGKWGFIDLKGNVISDIRIQGIKYFVNGITIIVYEGAWAWAWIDNNGNEIYDFLRPDFHEGRAWVSKDDKCGFIDLNYNLVTPLIYDHVDDFTEVRATVKKDGKWMYIDLNGNII